MQVQSILRQPRGMSRVMIEKTFGEDLESVQMLNRLLHQSFWWK
ncbi:hypothetical protein [Nitrosomonas sp. Is37]|nr:hypothetical protein [Nitrosomonas sp. Is37]MDV6344610.1 hypothetical protein [Nitrosomonas sp. Is37]